MQTKRLPCKLGVCTEGSACRENGIAISEVTVLSATHCLVGTKQMQVRVVAGNLLGTHFSLLTVFQSSILRFAQTASGFHRSPKYLQSELAVAGWTFSTTFTTLLKAQLANA